MESAEEAVELLSLAETLDGDDPAVSQAAAVVLGALCAKAAALLNGGEAYAESGALWRLALRVDPESREAPREAASVFPFPHERASFCAHPPKF